MTKTLVFSLALITLLLIGAQALSLTRHMAPAHAAVSAKHMLRTFTHHLNRNVHLEVEESAQ